MNAKIFVRQLHKERAALSSKLETIDQTLAALAKLGHSAPGHKAGKKFSAATRRKMARAAKARWAKRKATAEK